MAKTKTTDRPAIPGLTIGALALRAELAGDKMRSLARFSLGELDVEISLGSDSIWVLVRRNGKGGLAHRAACAPGLSAKVVSKDEGYVVSADSVLGLHTIRIGVPMVGVSLLRITSELTPTEDVLLPFLPRDLYPIDETGDPAKTFGVVEAAQRGVNGGMLYFRMEKPAFGNVFYFQNLTALNPYFEATGTKPDGVVGGEWPELGYQPPTAPLGNSPPTMPLPNGKRITISDALLNIRPSKACDEQGCALEFIEMLAEIYRQLDPPSTDFRDWPARAEQTLADLKRSPKATISHYGHSYIHPYVGAEYPDSMVQVSVLASIVVYSAWRGRASPLIEQFGAGLDKFYDKGLATLRRYLPNVGEDKDENAVDSWYLYHPLMNLGRMAKHGDDRARKLFLDSLGYAIKAAHHFDYKWPIQYDVRDFKVLVEARGDGRHGQTDVGGIYAYVMLLAHDLTADATYLDEAQAALGKLTDLRFDLIYQANLSAWGAVAAAQLWRATGDAKFFGAAHVFIAGLFHNSEIWESEIGTARHWRNFLGVTCLHDAPYMAIYECFETFCAFEEYLDACGEDINPSVMMLLAEYRRYALDRAWFYYPDALPAEALATTIRNGHIDPKLSFPLEDLYGDGQSCGQVGQEIYGCGAAMLYASLAFHRPPGAPFTVFCDRRIAALTAGKNELHLRVDAPTGTTTRVSVFRKGRTPLPETLVVQCDGHKAKLIHQEPERRDYEIASGDQILVRWR